MQHKIKMALNEDVLRLPGDPLPEGCVLRLYSMRMCPYAQRARLVLAAKDIKYDRVNIDLNNKPNWFFDVNPNGEVPVIIHNGSHIYQSLVCAEYVEEAFPTPKLYNTDPVDRAWEKIYYGHWNSKGIPAFYSLMKAGCLEPEQTKRLTEHITVMENFLQKKKTPYFSGNKLGFADYMIWPWFERMPMLGEITGFQMTKEVFPNLMAWIDKMWQDKAAQECKIDSKLFVDHYSKYRTGKPDFTIGAQKDNIVHETLENLDGLRDPSTRFRQEKN
ncbi:glutathione S-transferase omega-1 isoform X1 [Patella vulgata]|uniref:glutathione S-transferase omega-1 isoform X1 n=2 Tax=Patella vulgata TaxID=6465 RepID=UPI0021804FD2|nr:glutathione S-transferase omega-1 isoform X1 [Patella vulgata]